MSATALPRTVEGVEPMSTKRFASVWDAIEDTPEAAENMKLRSALTAAAAGLRVELRVSAPA
jgi:hypothetical protein